MHTTLETFNVNVPKWLLEEGSSQGSFALNANVRIACGHCCRCRRTGNALRTVVHVMECARNLALTTRATEAARMVLAICVHEHK
jgi:hypothetical protein